MKKYVDNFVDSVASRVAFLEGAFDEATQTLTLFSESQDPETGKPIGERHDVRSEGADTRVFNDFHAGSRRQGRPVDGDRRQATGPRNARRTESKALVGTGLCGLVERPVGGLDPGFDVAAEK